MLPLALLASSILIPASTSAAATGGTANCPSPRLSCSDSTSSHPDPTRPNSCCQPQPGGLFVFKQRFDPDIGDAGAWGIEGLDVLSCDGSPVPASASIAQAYTHEEIASFCLRSDVIGGEEGYVRAEKEWAQSEVGEGVEEVWERSWNTAGRLISTLAPACGVKAGSEAVPLFFDTLHRLHARYNTAKLLADADITPSADTTYSLSEITQALSLDVEAPYVTCDNVTLSTVHWPLEVEGTFQSGHFVPYTKLSTASSCPTEGIILPPSQAPMPKKEDPPRDPLDRPLLRPITKSYDPDRLYWKPTDAARKDRDDPKKLGFFKGKDQGREAKGGDKQYRRDEL